MLVVAAGIGAALLAGMLTVALHDAFRRPAFRRLAMRNLFRRRTETVLVVLGSSLGTAIIAAALLVGATFHASVRDGARTRLGPIDEQVTVAQRSNLGAVAAALSHPALPETDGLLTMVQATGAVEATRGARRVTEPSVTVGEADLDEARSFGGHPSDTGLAAAPRHLGVRDALIAEALADELGVSRGDQITLHAYGARRTFSIVGVLEPVGLAGATDLLVQPGTLEGLAARSDGRSVQMPQGIVLVSNTGRVFDSTGPSDRVTREIEARVHGRYSVSVEAAKADLLRDAANRGRSMGELFVGVGIFSVLAGVLLLVNLFVMLAEERKREMGLARATGLQRRHLVRVLTLEGSFYGLAAAFVGAFAGTALAWLVATTAAGILSGDSGFHLRFVAPVDLLVVAALIGLGISMATVWVTSLRLANLNIVRALRDLPDLVHARHRLRSSLPAGIGVAVGAALAVWGVVAIAPLAAVLGPPIGLCSAIPLLRPLVGRRTATAVASVGTLVWCIGVFTFLRRITDHTGVLVFVVQGVIMVAAAVGLATALDRVWSTGVGLLGRTGRGLAGRIGLAYPLEKVFRTGLLVGMYALIVFTLTFLVVYSRTSSAHMSTITRHVAAGADLLVETSPSDPVPAARLDAQPGVAGVSRLWRAAPRFTVGDRHRGTQWAVTGFEPSLLRWGVPHLSDRAAAYSSDRAAFAAMLSDPHLIVVDGDFLDTSDTAGPSAGDIGVSSVVEAHDPTTGRSTSYRVIGVVNDDVAEAGSWASAASVRALAGRAAVPSRFHVRVDRGRDPAAVAAELNTHLISYGVDASTFSAKVADQMSVELGFFSLMRRYLAIGLVVGIFGLAVVMVRASRSRRRQIGMLRTIGFTADTVRRIFLVEASFIAFQGIATGIGLGLLVSYQMLSRTASLGGDPLPWVVPWAKVAVLACIPFVASLVVALIPATQASSVDPAQVLRIAD